MNIYAFALILLDQLHQLCGVQLAIAALSFDDFRLFLQREILPLELWVHNLLVHTQNLVVSDGTRVSEVVHTCLLVLGHGDYQREQVVQDGVGIRDVDNEFVLCDLGYKGAWVQIVGDGHADAKREGVWVSGAHDVFDSGLGEGVEAAAEVGSVFFGEGSAGEGVALFVVLRAVDAYTWSSVPSVHEILCEKVRPTSSGHVGEMHAPLVAQLCQHQSSNHVAAHGFDSVVFAPVDVGTSGLTGTIDDVSWLELVKDLVHLGRVLHAVVGGMNGFALRVEKVSEMAADPALAAGKKKAIVRIHACCELVQILVLEHALPKQ